MQALYLCLNVTVILTPNTTATCAAWQGAFMHKQPREGKVRRSPGRSSNVTGGGIMFYTQALLLSGANAFVGLLLLYLLAVHGITARLRAIFSKYVRAKFCVRYMVSLWCSF